MTDERGAVGRMIIIIILLLLLLLLTAIGLMPGGSEYNTIT
jgi:hypothetical protein